MTSQIDATKPITGSPTTASVRDNFAVAKSEITALQNSTASGPWLSLNGGQMTGSLMLNSDPGAAREAATKQYVDQHAGSGTPGPIGPAGPPGQQGPQGPAGAQGIPGQPGAQGPQGLTGPIGPTGASGATGSQGQMGPQGQQGSAGATGATGPAGTYQTGPGLAINSGTTPPTIDVTTPYLALSGGTVTGNLSVNGGAVIGHTATPTTNALLINDTATQPQPGAALQGSLTVASETQVRLNLDAYGSNPAFEIFRRARGTAAAPTALQNGDSLGVITWQGYTGAAYAGGPQVSLAATENWSSTATGCAMSLDTVAAGTTTLAASLVLNGNTATFSGAVVVPSSLYLAVGGVSPYISTSGANGGVNVVSGSLNQPFVFYNSIGQAIAQFNTATPFATLNNTGSWGTLSDPRVKTDIAPYNAGLTEIELLEPISFRYNGELGAVLDDESTTRYGLDASAVEAVMPEMVGRHRNTAPDGTLHDEILTLETGPLIYALINAVKELSARLATLEGAR
jgi:hypothetical protein